MKAPSPRFRVLLHKRAANYLKKAPKHLVERVTNLLDDLERNPIPEGWDIAKISGEKDAFRVRIGEYRVKYKVLWEERVIVVTDVAPRGRIRY